VICRHLLPLDTNDWLTWDTAIVVSETYCFYLFYFGWLGSRVVSVLDSGAEGPGFKSQSRRCRVTVLGKLFTPIMTLFTKQQHLVARVTAGLAESNGSLPPGLWLTSLAGWLPRTGTLFYLIIIAKSGVQTKYFDSRSETNRQIYYTGYNFTRGRADRFANFSSRVRELWHVIKAVSKWTIKNLRPAYAWRRRNYVFGLSVRLRVRIYMPGLRHPPPGLPLSLVFPFNSWLSFQQRCAVVIIMIDIFKVA